MARKTKIDRLPAAVRDQIARRRTDGGHTIDEIRAELGALEIYVSRSALGRHLQRLDGADPDALVLVVDRLRREIVALRQEVSKAVRQIMAAVNGG